MKSILFNSVFTMSIMASTLLFSGCSGEKEQAVLPPPPPPANVAPKITSASSANAEENNDQVTFNVMANDPEGGALTYSLLDSADRSHFSIESGTGVLSLNITPNFERPKDADENNVYEVSLQVSDGSLTDSQAFSLTISDIDELPEGVSKFSVQTNRHDPLWAEMLFDNGNVYSLEGERDVGGFPALLTSMNMHIPATGPNDTADDVKFQFDGEVLTGFLINKSQRIRINYDQDGEPVSLVAITADGEAEAILPFSDFLANEGDEAKQAQKINDLKLAVKALGATNMRDNSIGYRSRKNDLPSWVTPIIKGQKPNDSAAPQNTSEADTLQVFVNVARCGKPFPGADVEVNVTLENNEILTRTANLVGTGQYRANFSINREDIEFEQACNKVFNPINYTCPVLDAMNAANITQVCAAFGAAIDTVLGGPTGEGALIFAVCESALVGGKLYCETLGKSPVDGAPAIIDGMCAGADSLIDFAFGDQEVIVDADVTMPQSSNLTAGPANASGAGSVSFDLMAEGEIEIENFKTTPFDPAPGQDYVASADIVCAEAPTVTNMRIVGTDGFSKSNQCNIVGDGTCNLTVPGAEQGVIDKITVNAGDKQKAIAITF